MRAENFSGAWSAHCAAMRVAQMGVISLASVQSLMQVINRLLAPTLHTPANAQLLVADLPDASDICMTDSVPSGASALLGKCC